MYQLSFEFAIVTCDQIVTLSFVSIEDECVRVGLYSALMDV